MEAAKVDPKKPLTTRQVSELLGCSMESVRMYGKLGYLTPNTRSGDTGRAKRAYYDHGEVEAFRKGGAPASAAYREKKNLPPRRRKQPA